MGFTKNKGWSVIIALIALVVFSVIAFILPVNHSILFWMGYSFTVFATLFLLSVILITLNKPSLNDKFHSLPIVNLTWSYFVIQLALSIWQMTNFTLPYFAAIIADTVLAAIFTIITILTYAAGNEIARVEEKVAEKVFYIKNLQADIELLSSSDARLSKALKDLAETARFSDPMSHSQLSSVENILINKLNLLQENITDVDVALPLCDEMQRLFAERNKKCKLLKNVPEPKPATDNSGIQIVAVGFGVINILIILLLVICFIIVPNAKYNEAMSLFNNEKYEQAIIAFENLGNYKDCSFKIEEAKEALLEELYGIAEDAYKNQQYVEAIKVYEELGDYKDSKDKIEHIYNMSATGGKIYFGVYENKPIPWKILHTDKEKMLLITEYPIETLAYHNELKNITWETSSIRQWLNDDFLNEFSDEQKNRLLVSVAKDINDNVFLLSQEEFEQYSSAAATELTSDWWLRTKTDAGMMFVSGETGELNTYGNGVVHALGVRPCVWVTLR